MLTLVGEDQLGIVAKITNALYQAKCNLGEASMIRLGGNFTIMLMVDFDGDDNALKAIITPVSDRLELSLHVDEIEGKLHQQVLPNIRVSVHGADRAGIVAQVTNALNELKVNILDLESDVMGGQECPMYIMHLDGYSDTDFEQLKQSLEKKVGADLHFKVSPIEALIG